MIQRYEMFEKVYRSNKSMVLQNKRLMECYVKFTFFDLHFVGEYLCDVIWIFPFSYYCLDTFIHRYVSTKQNTCRVQYRNLDRWLHRKSEKLMISLEKKSLNQ